MAKTGATEREFAGKVNAWVMEQIEHGSCPFQNVTIDSSLYGTETTLFPDVLITLDAACQQPYCGWELKTPKTDVRDGELLKNAVKKAQKLTAKYFVTWNMKTAIIWRTPEGTRSTVTEEYKQNELGPDPRINNAEDLRDPIKSVILKDMCARIVLDLARLYKDEHINLPQADTTVFVSLIANTSEEMSATLYRDINASRADKKFDKELKKWAVKQGINQYDQNYYHTLSQQIAYRIIGKILFYITLRRHRLELKPMKLPTNNTQAAHKELHQLFQKALEVDYQAIFERDITDQIKLSKQTMRHLIELTEKLDHWSFELMPLDVIGKVFERLIPPEARHSLGQYFTPDNLVDLIITFCIQHGNDFVMDPTCGTGTFLIRSYQLLKHLKSKTHAKLLNQLWGFDIAGFPSELATINLYRQDFSDYINFPRVLSKDFFTVMPGNEFEFPPTKKTARLPERIKVAIPDFDALVGNFPFIRQELIEKVEKGYKKKLEGILYENWSKEYPDLFSNHEICLSGQADIYAYMFFHAAAHLKEGGRMGFITSNSWLDVAYGYELQKFFLSKFKIIAICESRCEPWFEQSAVNTVFTILERCNEKEEIDKNLVRFIEIKKPLAELFPEDPLLDSQSRWIKLQRFVDKIESIACTGKPGKNCETIKKIKTKYIHQPEVISYEDDEIRIRIVKQTDLHDQLDKTGQTVKWGVYLRAPDVYFKYLNRFAKELIPLGELVKIRRGYTTGKNEFFYLTEDQIQHWGIEKEYLKPVIKSPKESEKIRLDKKSLKLFAFFCHKDKSELKGTNALKYIKWGEDQTDSSKKKWNEIPTVKGRKRWYELPEREPGKLLLPMVTGSSLRCIYNKDNVKVDHNLFELMIKDKKSIENLAVFLNSAFTFLQRELIGRANLGDGALKIEGIDWERILIPKVELLNRLADAVQPIFDKISKRVIKGIGEEAKLKDRKEFESAVLEALGLPKSWCKEILDGVVGLVADRHLLPKLRSAKKKIRQQRDLTKFAEEIAEEVLPNGPKKFPEEFLPRRGNIKFKELSFPLGRLKLGESFFGNHEICDEEGNHLKEVAGAEKAKYIVYAKKSEESLIKIPENETILCKSVNDYENYLHDLCETIFRAFMEQSGDFALSENLTRKVFEEFSIPYISQ